MRKLRFSQRLLLLSALLLTAGLTQPLPAQASAPSPALRDSLIGTVQALFNAMATRDTSAARRLLIMSGHAFATFPTTGDTAGVGTMDHAQFLSQLGGKGDPWRERMWNPTVLVHGNLAVVWTPYDFHNGTKFSHCGVDTFTLFRTRDGWRIADLAYTVEPTGCAPSPLGPIK